ncbi:NUDIX domain-containing protein [Hyphococcus sp. DH-69]|uniref:NUDIX domain-containing protein n=1 Tax=Hyphococcus formosus TaxID=3143534 RepID=UPI00398B86F6
MTSTKPQNKKIGPWEITSTDEIFSNPWISLVRHDVLQPDGSPGTYGVVRFQNLAIGVLPIDSDGYVTLVGQHRFPSDKYSWELPEGGGNKDLPPLEAAKRELAEETGLRANSWLELTKFDVSNSVTDEQAICYLAWDLEPGPAAPEPSEDLTIQRVPFKTLLNMVLGGEISDNLTIVMTLTAYIKALRGEVPAPISPHILDVSERK